MPDPTLTNSGTGAASTASVTATFGFTATAGRLLIMSVTADDYDTGPPTGWTQPAGCAQEINLGHYLWYKIAAGGETSAAYSLAGAAWSAWAVCEFDNISGFDTGVSAGQSTNVTDSSYSTPTVTPSSGRRFAVAAIAGNTNGANYTDIGSWTNSYVERADAGFNGTTIFGRVAIATLALDGTGSATTSTTATYSGGVTPWRSGLIAVFNVTTTVTARPKPLALIGIG